MKKMMIPMLALTFGLAACSNDEPDETTEERVTPVETAEVAEENLEITKQFYGRTSPESMTPVMSPAPGEVEELNVEQGEQVEEGEVLASILTSESPAPLEVEAPQDGQVANLSVQEGGVASNSEPIMTIVDLASILVEIHITASDLSLFEEVEEALVTIENANFEEEVSINHVATVPGETGLYTVELIVENEENEIKPGMSAVVAITEQVVEDTLIVPTAALVEENERTFVYRIENEQAVEVPVTIVEAQSDRTAIEGELAEGDMVVTRGQLTLRDGSPVSVEREEQ